MNHCKDCIHFFENRDGPCLGFDDGNLYGYCTDFVGTESFKRREYMEEDYAEEKMRSMP